jgi:hypothetical protein
VCLQEDIKEKLPTGWTKPFNGPLPEEEKGENVPGIKN